MPPGLRLAGVFAYTKDVSEQSLSFDAERWRRPPVECGPEAAIDLINDHLDSVLPQRRVTPLLRVAGGTGAGKSQFTETLRTSNGHLMEVLPQDWFFLGESHNARQGINFDQPEAVALAEADGITRRVVLAGERRIRMAPYSHATSERGQPETIAFSANLDVVVAEGLHAFKWGPPPMLDIFVHAEPAERGLRRVLRDIRERGASRPRDVLEYFLNTLPLHEQHVEDQRRQADVIVDTTTCRTADEWENLARAAMTVSREAASAPDQAISAEDIIRFFDRTEVDLGRRAARRY